MKLVPEGTPLERPGICFLCKGTPNREVGERVIDTEFQFDPPGMSNLRGREYVCEKCAKTIGNLIGLVDAKHFDGVAEELAKYKTRFDDIRHQFDEANVS